MVFHPFKPTVRGVGCIGRITDEMQARRYYKRAYNTWDAMLGRCYDKAHPDYSSYGGAGAIVAAEWKCFSKFLNSISNVAYFHEWVNNPGLQYSLDKDYYGSNCYSESTCIFLMPQVNQGVGNPVRDNKTGILYESISAAAEARWVPRSASETALASEGTWEDGLLETYTPPAGYLVRPIKVIDQLAELIEGLRRDPFGRRHILSAWNPGELKNMALPPCHNLAQFYVSQGKLSCQLYQRSADCLLGVPYNVASYALLTHMIAQVCGYKVGEFIHTMADAHIYHDHLGAVKEQLSRSPKAAPHLYIDPTIKEIDQFTMDSFDIMGYDPHPAIKVKMAV
jgi:hypothetical protein